MAEADRSFENGVGGIAGSDGFFGEGFAGFEIGRRTEQCGCQFELDCVAFFDEMQHLDRLVHYFWADSVAGKQCHLVCCHGVSSPAVFIDWVFVRTVLFYSIQASPVPSPFRSD